MKTKMLFITCMDIKNDSFGGPKGTERNYRCLCNYGDVDMYLIQKRSNLHSMLSVLEGFHPPVDLRDLKKIRRMLAENDYRLVFFDTSLEGKLIQKLRKQIPVAVVFFHNCELDYTRYVRFQSISIKKILYMIAVKHNENFAVKYSDYRIALSRRDCNRIEELYGVRPESVLPLTIVDRYDGKGQGVGEKSCLLFGPVGPANIEAFSWFVKNVSPYLHCKTIVAGKGFEEYTSWNNEKVSVIGYVESLSDLYSSVSCVAIPLLSGGGMKVKTVEAMMFGKSIFGTDEAFEGYEVDYEKIGALCNSADAFIKEINTFVDNNGAAFNKYSRNLYIEKYCVEASEKLFEEMMNSLGFHRMEA